MDKTRLGCIYARTGKPKAASQIIQDLEEMVQDDASGMPYYNLAIIHAVLGDKSEAVSNLKKAFVTGVKFKWSTYDMDPELVSLHDYQPYEDFVFAWRKSN